MFAEIGVAVKEQSPFEKTYIIGLAGGRGGNIPTAAEYLEGGYVAIGTPFAPQTEQVLIDASLEMIGRFQIKRPFSQKLFFPLFITLQAITHICIH